MTKSEFFECLIETIDIILSRRKNMSNELTESDLLELKSIFEQRLEIEKLVEVCKCSD